MRLREVIRARSCGASLAVSRTVNLIHRAWRRHLRDRRGGGWVVHGAEWPGVGPGAVGPSLALVSWKEGQACLSSVC